MYPVLPEQPKRRLIVLIDFSETSANLLRYAFDWSKLARAELCLVHHTEIISPALSDHDHRSSLIARINDEGMEKLKKLVETVMPGEAIPDCRVSEKPLKTILHNLEEEEADNLVLVGLKGTGLLKQIFLGSVALQVIENTHCAVAAVPRETDRFHHRKIFVALTPGQPLNFPALQHLLDFVSPASPELVFFSLLKKGESARLAEKNLRETAAFFAGRCRSSHILYQGQELSADMVAFIKQHINDMLVLQKGSRLLAENLFRKFLVNELVYAGQLPLVVLP